MNTFDRLFHKTSEDFDLRRLDELGSLKGDNSELAGQMVDKGEEYHPKLDLGYVFLGQFVDHDITFDAYSSLERTNFPEKIVNFRSPALDLDSMYAHGPRVSPWLYKRERGGTTGEFILGEDSFGDPNDLPRNRWKQAIIGDPRNDEHQIIAQMHLLFMKFHNKVYRYHTSKKDSTLKRFDDARRLVTQHYQSIVLNDFLPKILDNGVLSSVLNEQPRLYAKFKEPKIPVEFSVAAYRFGHSAIRSMVRLNDEVEGVNLMRVRGNMPMQPYLKVDWKYYFDISEQTSPMAASLINTKIAGSLFDLPGATTFRSLPLRNLRRGYFFDLPSGQEAVKEINKFPGISLEAVETPRWKLSNNDHTPLWYYCLWEAERVHHGTRLGPTASWIVAEVFNGLLLHDPESILSQKPDWTPTLSRKHKDEFTMIDLVNFVDE